MKDSDAYGWANTALCAQIDPDLWHDGLASFGYATAKHYCRRCPVLAECIDAVIADEWGLEKQRRLGVWGGMTPAARVKEEQRRRATEEVAA